MQNTTSAQDALLAIGSVCNQLPGGGFERYMQHFVPLLVQCISAVGDARLSVLAITITADVARALEGKLAAFSDPIVEALLLVHNNPAVDSEIHQVAFFEDIDLLELIFSVFEGPRLYQTSNLFLYWRHCDVSWRSDGQVLGLLPSNSTGRSRSCCCNSTAVERVKVKEILDYELFCALMIFFTATMTTT